MPKMRVYEWIEWAGNPLECMGYVIFLPTDPPTLLGPFTKPKDAAKYLLTLQTPGEEIRGHVQPLAYPSYLKAKPKGTIVVPELIPR